MNPELNPMIRVAFPYRGGILFFPLDQIVRLQSDSNYTHVYLKGHKPLYLARVLADYSEILEPQGFIRTHRSHLINPMHVSKVTSNLVIMDDESHAEISRSRRKQVIRALVQATA